MYGAVLEKLVQNETEEAAAQSVQNMKAIHEFASRGKWEVAWPLTFLADPLRSRRHGADEEELEAIPSYLKVQHEIETKVLRTSAEEQGSEDDEDPGRASNQQSKKKASKGGGKAAPTGQ